jgi:predicted AlkP superfamily pyrophosphatase or phosphodiesterase
VVTVGSSANTVNHYIKKSLVVAWDGVNSEALLASNTPFLNALADGSWALGYHGEYTTGAYNLTDAPTNSGPNHWAIETGATGTQSGVLGNNDVDAGDSVEFPHYLSILEREDPVLKTAHLFTWDTDALIPVTADYIKNDEDEPNVSRVVSMLQGTYEDPTGTDGTNWAEGSEPDAIFLFLDNPDHTGHSYGYSPSSTEYVTSLETADKQLGAMLNAIKTRPSFATERWQIILTADHGGIGTGHGGESEAEHRIMFLLASQNVQQGTLPAYDTSTHTGTRNFDTVPTVLNHFDIAIPKVLMGSVR